MTPEKAQYHLLMLRLGQREEYDRELDRILIEEDPLPPLVLELALCMSDLNKTISVLREYLLDHPANQEPVYHMVLADLRQKYTLEHLTPAETVALMYSIIRMIDRPDADPWWQLYGPIDDFDLVEAGIFSEESFNRSLAEFLNGENWADVRLIQPGNKKSFLNFFRRKGEKP